MRLRLELGFPQTGTESQPSDQDERLRSNTPNRYSPLLISDVGYPIDGAEAICDLRRKIYGGVLTRGEHHRRSQSIPPSTPPFTNRTRATALLAHGGAIGEVLTGC